MSRRPCVSRSELNIFFERVLDRFPFVCSISAVAYYPLTEHNKMCGPPSEVQTSTGSIQSSRYGVATVNLPLNSSRSFHIRKNQHQTSLHMYLYDRVIKSPGTVTLAGKKYAFKTTVQFSFWRTAHFSSWQAAVRLKSWQSAVQYSFWHVSVHFNLFCMIKTPKKQILSIHRRVIVPALFVVPTSFAFAAGRQTTPGCYQSTNFYVYSLQKLDAS